MNADSTASEIVFRTNARSACMELRLVLEAAGIAAGVSQRDGWWMLIVGADDRLAAIAEIEAYQQDNADRTSAETSRVAVFGGGFAGAFVYAITLVLIDFYSRLQTFGIPWVSAGQMRSGDVMAGEWWRVVTALTLHADAQHLMSNLAFGCVFGLMAGRILGGGVAWLAIVIAGSLGNLLNAMMREPGHTSIGASTAVFGALGIMVAHALRPRASTPEKPMKRWSPLIGGVLLLAFIGVGGERTDVGAHFTGFLGGLAIGWIGCRVPERIVASTKIQFGSGLAAFGMIVAAWIAAVGA